ncbi:MAG: PEP-CTERM sorting domain-containing protein [Rubrivivax sp.]
MQATSQRNLLSLARTLAAAGVLAASMATPAFAQSPVNLNFTTLNPTAGTFASCTTTDRCAASGGTISAGAAMRFTTGGLTVNATGLTRGTTVTNATAVQDYNGTTALPWIGLGVYPTSNITAGVDQVGLNDVLKLDFGTQLVRLTGLQFYNSNHGTTFDAGNWVGLSTTAPTGTGTPTNTFAFGVNGATTLATAVTGTTFYLYGLSNDAQKAYYVGGLTVTPVPEPGTLGLMAAGLGVVAMVSRRRRALVQG